jgi:hypothetical protein
MTALRSPDSAIAPVIRIVRGQRVILDADLARLYEVPTKRFNEAVRRNPERFPEDFCFQLTREEVANLRSQIATSSLPHGGLRYLPLAFTEHGALMAANILRSPRAVQMSVFVIRAFIRLREELATNATILKRLAEIDKTLLVHDSALRELFQQLRALLAPPPEKPKRKIGFHAGNR